MSAPLFAVMWGAAVRGANPGHRSSRWAHSLAAAAATLIPIGVSAATELGVDVRPVL